jgi:hypothetical protein
MQKSDFQPSERARSCVQDRDIPDYLVTRDPLLTLAEKRWVLRHRLEVRGVPDATHAARMAAVGASVAS